MFDIIIPTFNGQCDTQYVSKMAQNHNIIIVNSGEILEKHTFENENISVIQFETQSRAARLNRGILESRNNIIILHHPRSYLADHFSEELISIKEDIKWGAFSHSFDFEHPLLKFTSWYSNIIRGDLKKIYYLDHCIFIKRDIKTDIFPIEEVDIFEDTIICERLKKYNSIRLTSKSTTSAIRFKKNGMLRQSILNQILKIMYKLKISHKLMNKVYEKSIKLNSDYK